MSLGLTVLQWTSQKWAHCRQGYYLKRCCFPGERISHRGSSPRVTSRSFCLYILSTEYIPVLYLAEVQLPVTDRLLHPAILDSLKSNPFPSYESPDLIRVAWAELNLTQASCWNLGFLNLLTHPVLFPMSTSSFSGQAAAAIAENN